MHKLHAEGRPDVFRKKFGKKLAQYIYEFFADEQSRVVVAKKDGVICGFASIEVIRKPRSPYNKARTYLKVTEFGVDKKHKRQGIHLGGIAKGYAGFRPCRIYMEFKN